MNEENTIKIYTTVSEQSSNEQEEFGGNPISNLKNKLLEIKVKDIEKQIKDNFIGLVNSIDTSCSEIDLNMNLSKITVKFGFTIEGKIFIASSKLESGIELEFTKK